MRGSGTITDPFIITTAAELWSTPDYGDSGLYFALGCDIDLNGCFDNSPVMPIPLECACLDGRGHRIRNLYANGASTNMSVFQIYDTCTEITIKNLIIENFKLSSQRVMFFAGNNCTLHLYNCTIGAHIGTTLTPSSRCSVMNKNGLRISADLCSFILRLTVSTPYNLFTDCTLERCQVRTEIISNTLASRSPSYDRYYLAYCDVTDCIFIIDLIPIAAASPQQYFLPVNQCVFRNSYFDFGSSDTTLFLWSISPTTPCFCIQRTPDTTTYTGTVKAYILTQQEAKSASYLHSIGFDVTEG